MRIETELLDEIKIDIKKISDKPDDYNEKYIKTKSNLDNNLPLNKVLKLHNLQ